MSQLDLPFTLNEQKLSEFLTRYVALENEIDRLGEEKRLLKENYSAYFPMRGILTAVKIVRARIKLIEHPKDGMKGVHLAVLETLVEQHLSGVSQAMEALHAAIEGRVSVGEVSP